MRQRGGKLFFLALLLSPTLFGILYYGFIATPRYVSEAKFIVRTAAKPAASFSAFLQMTGLTRSQDDVFSVDEFISSSDAVRLMREQLPLFEIYGRPEADFLVRFPSLFFGRTLEEFHKYFQWMISISYNSTSGLSTLRVEAFRPEDANAVASVLLDLGEKLVNQMNFRIQNDAVKIALEEVDAGQRRLIAAQIAITQFRNKELMIDPVGSSVANSELIAQLSGSLAETQMQYSEMIAASPSNPQIAALQRKADALTSQIALERNRISNGTDGLAGKVESYERLTLEREFAQKSLASAENALETARLEARRQQLYLQRVVQPNVPDYPTKPGTIRAIATITSINLLALMIGWLILSGIREHAAIRR